MIFDLLEKESYKLRQEMVSGCFECEGTGVIIVDGSDATPKGIDCLCVERWKTADQAIRAGIPKGYWDVHSFDFSGIRNRLTMDSIQRYTRHLKEARNHGLSLFLAGDVDAGKTTAGCYIAIEALAGGWSVFYVVMERLASWWRQGVTMNGSDRAKIEADLRLIEFGTDFLIIDELGKESGKDGSYVRSRLDALLRGRVANGLPFVCISQMNLPDIQGKYGGPLASLLTERVKHLNFMTERFRQKGQKQWKDLMEGGNGHVE